MDCEKSLCCSTRKGLFSIQKEFTCAICHELFVRAHTLACSHSYCERCIFSWMKKNQDCPTCRKPIQGKPIHSIALDNAVGKLVELRVESFAERSRKNSGAKGSVTKAENCVVKKYECGTQTTQPRQSRDSNKNKHYYNGGYVRHFFHPQNGGPCHEFHFINASDYDEYSDDYSDYDSYSDDFSDDDDYNGLPGYYWGGYGTCFNCGKLIGMRSSTWYSFCLQVILTTGPIAAHIVVKYCLGLTYLISYCMIFKIFINV